MAQKKLLRFAQLKEMSNVLEYPQDIKGNWQHFFKNDHPIVLELACGRGEYTVGMAAMHPHKNFIGVDVKGNRMYIGAKKASDNHLSNAAFLRTQIEMIDAYFAPGEVAEIWLTFPDPQLRMSKAKKRLTHPRFLRLYQRFLQPGGSIHLKTDSPALHRFTSRVAELYGLSIKEESDNVYASPHAAELDIKTHYEMLDIAQSKKIHYLQFCLPAIIPDKDEALAAIIQQTETGNEQA